MSGTASGSEQKKGIGVRLVVHPCNPFIWETVEGGLGIRLGVQSHCWLHSRFVGQPGLCETLS